MLKRLLAELRRRRVPQVAGFYLAAGWVAFEVAEGTFPRLGLPDWTITFVLVLLLLAFPLVVGLAWFYDLGPDGVTRTPDNDPRAEDGVSDGSASQDVEAGSGHRAADTAAASSSTGAFGRIAVTGAVLVLALAGGAFVLFGDGESDVEVAADVMAVLPFTVRGGDETAVLADGMVELLSAKLDGAGELRSADPHAVLSLAEGGVDVDESRALARRLGAGHFVLGSVLQFGGDLRLQAAIYRTDGDAQPVAEASVEGAATSFLELVDDLATELLVAGEMAPPGRLPRIAALTTEDLDALRYFLEGERALRETRYDDAIPLFERAVEADSAFALAYYRMSVAASWVERPALRDRSMRAALRYRDRLGERDRSLVQAWVAHKEGRHVEARDQYRDILASYPDDLEAWYELGEVLLHRGAFLGVPPEEAESVYRRALELDPDLGAALYHLSNIAAWHGDLPLLDSTTQALREETGTGDAGSGLEAQYAFVTEDSAGMERTLETIRRGGGGQTAFTPVFAAWNARDGDAIRRILDAMAESPGSLPGVQSSVAHELAGRGLRDEGLAWLEARELDRTGVPARTTALAVLPFLRTPPEQLERLRSALEAWDPGPVRTDRPDADDWAGHDWFLPHLRLYLMALAETRLGRSGEALRLAAELPGLGGIPEVRTLAGDLALHVRAQVAMDQGQPGEALRIIEQSAFWEVMPWDERFSAILFRTGPVELKADALMELRRYRDAIRWHSVVTFGSDRGYSHYRRAQAYEALGEPQRAAEHYAEFLRLWEDADPDLRDRVEDARSRLETLVGEGGGG